jgi:hypothetical protein
MPSTAQLIVFALLIGAVLPISDAQSQTSPRLTTLPITVLPTEFGLPDESARTYSASLSLEVPPQLEIAAYGAAGHVWLAPPSWTGQGSVGADGGMSVQLHPTASDGVSGSRITYRAVPGCRVCMLGSAAPYFPDALKQFNEEYNRGDKNPVAAPGDLAITRVTSHLVTSALPSRNGLLVRGAAFYDSTGDGFYEEVTLTLPIADERLAEFLLKYFGDGVGLR